MKFVSVALLGALLLATSGLRAADPSPDDIEFFEKKIRPLLVEACQKCHGAEKQQGGLRLDSRDAAFKGGDIGAPIQPGKPAESLLIEAIRYDGDIKMPPKGKLEDEQIALLTEWVKRGAPWPSDRAVKPNAKNDFDLAARKAAQWCFRPLQDPIPPTVQSNVWPQLPINRFILAKLEAAGLTPAPPADKRTLLRRVTYDLIGLPPTPAEIDAFLADESPRAYEKVVTRLLDSPHYGERWGRHWLDLVRFAETHGHEFDFEIPHAYEYRDYVIRAFNADVPYNQFVIEHIAGDLMEQPRTHPTEKLNESIVGTGFWFFGEAAHSPVDVRADEADRIDNQIDVFSKTFLAQTVACARCHDHKFDAISTRDYYALKGFLQSSRYQVASFDGHEWRRFFPGNRIEHQWISQVGEETKRFIHEKLKSQVGLPQVPVGNYLLAALAVLRPDFDKSLVAGGDAQVDFVFEDFEKSSYAGWTAKGTAFGDGPNRKPLPDYQGDVGALGEGFVNSHSFLNKKGKRTAKDELTGTLTSDKFTISRPYVHFLIGGGAHAGKTCLNLWVNDKVERTATGDNANRMRWKTFEVRDLVGKEARFEIVDDETGGWGNIGLDQIVFSYAAAPGATNARVAAAAKKYGVEVDGLTKWTAYLREIALKDEDDPFQSWALLATGSGELTDGAFAKLRAERANALRSREERFAREQEGRSRHFDAFTDDRFGAWLVAGEAFGAGPLRSPFLLWNGGAPRAPRGVIGRGLAHSGIGSNRLQGALRSPTFTIDKPRIHFHAAGTGTKVNLILDGLQLIRNPIYGGLTISLTNEDRLKWYTIEVSKWIGHNAYLEFLDEGDGFVAVDDVVFSEEGPPVAPMSPALRELWGAAASDSPEKLACGYQKIVEDAVEFTRDAENRMRPPETKKPLVEDTSFVRWVASHDLPGALSLTVGNSASPIREKRTQHEAESEVEQLIKYDRKAVAMVDGSSEDDRVHIRGNAHKFGDVVPRRFLEAIAGEHQPPLTRGSGRLELAQRVVDPANPLLARVMVNRIWKHHFGVGLVPTVDDFGNMGQPPSHPELLDWLATQFIKSGWSIKHMHRLMLLSSVHQMSSRADDARAEEIDPENKLLHRANLRRLEAEAIRDAMLAVSGRLDRKMYGPSVLPHLTPFMLGRGRPGQSGPLDGDGRRSIYINVRRNFLTPMFLAFDYPAPFGTIGRRSVSNVPAQALSLMNNPFVLGQAELWAKHAIEQQTDPAARITAMYIAAFSRPPEQDELDSALAFVSEQSRQYRPEESLRPWTDLAHVLLNVKEFIFVN